MDTIKSPPPAWTVEEALEQVRAALPDPSFAAQHGVSREMLERLSLMIKHSEPSPERAVEALIVLREARAALPIAWANCGEEPRELGELLDACIGREEVRLDLDTRECYVNEATRSVIDVIRDDGRTMTLGSTREEVQSRYPNAKRMKLYEARHALESGAIEQNAREISAEDFVAALEVLPPKKWIRGGDTESFMSSEHYYGSVTSIYARIGDRHFAFNDRCTLSHDAIVKKVRETAGGFAVKKKSPSPGF